MIKSDQIRPYPPDFVSAETLAYRLDCSVRSVQDYAKSGIIPKPITIGNLVRWRWSDIVEHLAARNDLANRYGGIGKDDACAYAIDKAKQAREKANGRTA